MKTMAQIINEEIKESTYEGKTRLVCRDKDKIINFKDYFILITTMFNRYGYQTWKDNKLIDYDWCHLESPGRAEINAKLHIVGCERIFNLTKKK